MDDSRALLRKCCWSIILLAVLVLFGIYSRPVYAQQLVGSIQLDCHVQCGDQTLPLAGDTYAIVQVADIAVQGQGASTTLTYRTKEAFQSFDCDWAALTDNGRQAKALELETYAQAQHLLTTTQTTDQNGCATFDGLSTGLYLVVRTQVADANSAYTTQAFLVDVPTILSETVYYDLTAVPKFEYQGIYIRPCNVTIYMGGNEGYDAVDGQESDSLPRPMFVIQAPEGVKAEQLVFQYRSSGTGNGSQWQAVYIGHDEEGNECYRLDRMEGTEENFHVRYLAPDGNVILDDVFEPQIDKELFKLYGVDIHLEDGTSLIAYDAKGTLYPVMTGSAELTVRGVERTEITGNAENPVTDVITQGETIPQVPAGVGVVVAPKGTSYTLNETDIQIGNVHGNDGTMRVGLLFDDIMNEVYDRQSLLESQADARMPELAPGATRHFQSQYLDLVDMNDGNAWVMASNPVEVYWGYPEGTDQNTSFTLWHFAGLHRDGTDDPGESGYDLEDILAVEPEKVAIENTPQGIQFTVEPGGFSPFVLVWEENSENVTPPDSPSENPSENGPEIPTATDETDGNPVRIPFLPQTGDDAPIGLLVVILIVSLSAFIGISLYRKKHKD